MTWASESLQVYPTPRAVESKSSFKYKLEQLWSPSFNRSTQFLESSDPSSNTMSWTYCVMGPNNGGSFFHITYRIPCMTPSLATAKPTLVGTLGSLVSGSWAGEKTLESSRTEMLQDQEVCSVSGGWNMAAWRRLSCQVVRAFSIFDYEKGEKQSTAYRVEEEEKKCGVKYK